MSIATECHSVETGQTRVEAQTKRQPMMDRTSQRSCCLVTLEEDGLCLEQVSVSEASLACRWQLLTHVLLPHRSTPDISPFVVVGLVESHRVRFTRRKKEEQMAITETTRELTVEQSPSLQSRLMIECALGK